MRHCNSCTLKTGNSCDPNKYARNIKSGDITYGCGCNLLAKTRSVDVECPLSKW